MEDDYEGAAWLQGIQAQQLKNVVNLYGCQSSNFLKTSYIDLLLALCIDFHSSTVFKLLLPFATSSVGTSLSAS
ncbi:Actin-related protein 5 [Frankliniella fusca]|uniref:Actin-related protein 5 n=1 Tax=Frankliniella fusca TaxID=407009 RepID=A0AAE1HKY7_9NEOP|nr:Actin-related protein 5 [Frankliniella fusca]